MTIHHLSHMYIEILLSLLSLSLWPIVWKKMMKMRAKGSTTMGGHVKTSLGSLVYLCCNLSWNAFKQWLLQSLLLFPLLKDPQQHCFFPFFKFRRNIAMGVIIPFIHSHQVNIWGFWMVNDTILLSSLTLPGGGPQKLEFVGEIGERRGESIKANAVFAKY